MERIRIKLPSGAALSIVTGDSAYCTPRDNNWETIHTHVEVGILKGRAPRSWEPYFDGAADSMDDDVLRVFGYLPVELLGDFYSLNSLPIGIEQNRIEQNRIEWKAKDGDE